MQICYASCFVLASLIVSSYVDADSKNRHLVDGRDEIRGITKREISLLIDNFPSESNSNNANQKVIYSRISKQRYRGPKSKHTQPYKYRPQVPKYGPPTPKYNPPQTKRRPPLSSKGKLNAKKFKRNHLKKVKGPAGLRFHSESRPSKSKLGYKNKAYKHRPMPPQKVTHYTPYQSSEPTGFGEPPAEAHLTSNYDIPKPTANDIPIDSYGNLLQNRYNENTNDVYNNQQIFNQEYPPNGQPANQLPDSGFAYSNNHPTIVTPGPGFFETDDYAIDVHSEISQHNDKQDNNIPKKIKEKDKLFFNKLVNKPWTKDNEIIVGGQYAEPPARYVPKFQPSAPMIVGSDEFSPYNGIPEEFGSSATVSAYVNYKNTNMAFSPQNLNDAFSIVDK